MRYDYHLDRTRRRMHFQGSGIWDVEIAHRFASDMKGVRLWAIGLSTPFSVLSDLSGLSVHSQEVGAIVGDGANHLSGLPLDRYAMIVPSFLMRMQVRRIDPFPQRRLFQSVSEALDWLEWEEFTPRASGDRVAARSIVE